MLKKQLIMQHIIRHSATKCNVNVTASDIGQESGPGKIQLCGRKKKTLLPTTLSVSSRDDEKHYEQATWDEQLSHLSQSCAWDWLSVSL